VDNILDGYNEGSEDILQAFEEDSSTGGTKVPLNSRRNKASLSAFLTGDPENALGSYNLFMAESEQGSSTLQDEVLDKTTARIKQYDFETVNSILGDPSVPFAQKQKAIEAYQVGGNLQDPSMALYTDNVAKGSAGENVEQENSRVITASEIVNSVHADRRAIQALKNAHESKIDQSVASGGFGQYFSGMVAADVVPFATNVTASKVAGIVGRVLGEEDRTLLGKIKDGILAGHSLQDSFEAFKSLPVSKRRELSEALANEIENNSSIVYRDQNDYNRARILRRFVDDEDYTNTDKWIDTLSGALDLFGVGELIKGTRTVVKARAAAKASKDAPVTQATPAAKDTVVTRPVKTAAPITEADLASITAPKKVPVSKQAEFDALEQEKANLLGDLNLADNGAINNIRSELKQLDANKPKAEDVQGRAKQIQSLDRVSYRIRSLYFVNRN
jgi:hypothetical protein